MAGVAEVVVVVALAAVVDGAVVAFELNKNNVYTLILCKIT